MRHTFIALAGIVGGSVLMASKASAEVPQPPPPVISDQSWGGHVSYVAGYKGLDSKWESAKNQLEVGALDLDIRPPGAGISIAAQALVSLASEGPDTLGKSGESARTTEFNLGLRKVFENQSSVAPFLGAGLAVVNADAESKTDTGDTRSDSAWAVGAWGGGGLYWYLTETIHVGAAVQYTWAQADLFDERHNFGGVHAMLMVGLHW
jgi:opacity protein-like surface antigen